MPGKTCPSLIEDHYLVGIDGPVQREICEIPQAIAVDLRSGLQATADTPANHVERRIFNIWPPRVATFLRTSGVPVDRVPPYDLSAMSGQRYYPPEILNPRTGSVYYRRLDRIANEYHGIKLAGAATNRVQKVSWLLDGQLMAQTAPGEEIVVNPLPGDHRVTLLDDVGGKDEVLLIVKDYRTTTSPASPTDIRIYR